MLKNLNYVQYLNITPMKKPWFMVSIEYSPNEKSIMAPMKCTLMVYIPNGKDMVLWNIAFWSGNRWKNGKRWKNTV